MLSTNVGKKSLTWRSREHITSLEGLPGWVWDALDQQWREAFGALETYIAEHGDARVVITHKTQDGFALGIWVRNQRVAKKESQLSQERITRLEALVGWVWSAKE